MKNISHFYKDTYRIWLLIFHKDKKIKKRRRIISEGEIISSSGPNDDIKVNTRREGFSLVVTSIRLSAMELMET